MVLSLGVGNSKLCVIRPISEACSDDVDAVYSKFESLG